MKITDQTIIDSIMNTADEVNDGFFAFCAQGQRCIEMIKYSGKAPKLNGFEGFYETVMFHIVVHKAGGELDLTELSQFESNLSEAYMVESNEFYGEERTAYARLMSLIAEHNHF